GGAPRRRSGTGECDGDLRDRGGFRLRVRAGRRAQVLRPVGAGADSLPVRGGCWVTSAGVGAERWGGPWSEAVDRSRALGRPRSGHVRTVGLKQNGFTRLHDPEIRVSDVN